MRHRSGRKSSNRIWRPHEWDKVVARVFVTEPRSRTTEHTHHLQVELNSSRLRIGSVPYLNAAPLTWGLEKHITFCPPAVLAGKLRSGEVDAGLVSVTEVLFNDRYDILDGIAVASRGEVQSVFLAHRGPIELARRVHCDPASLTSVNLLRLLLAERGLHPEFRPLPIGFPRELPDAFLLIGDRALRFRQAPRSHALWDLGQAWHEAYRLPFVYAVWALRRGVHTKELRNQLYAARDAGLASIESIVSRNHDFPGGFVRQYLQCHLRYELGAEEKRGLATFASLLATRSSRIYRPRYVD